MFLNFGESESEKADEAETTRVSRTVGDNKMEREREMGSIERLYPLSYKTGVYTTESKAWGLCRLRIPVRKLPRSNFQHQRVCSTRSHPVRLYMPLHPPVLPHARIPV